MVFSELIYNDTDIRLTVKYLQDNEYIINKNFSLQILIIKIENYVI